MKVVIVGAGVMGLMQARELARKGVDVVLLDKGLLGQEASWAGGGIISPLYPWRYSDPVTTLASWSQANYPNLIEAIHHESGIDPELSSHGLLMLSVHDESKALNWAERFSSWLEPVNKDVIYELEPQLRASCERALWMSKVGSIRNPRLLKALREIVEKDQNIEVKQNTPIESILTEGDFVQGVITQEGEKIEADKVLICSGAWSANLLDLPQIDIHPVKGQMLVFDAVPGLVNRVVMSNGKYAIPRRDGKVVIGSTIEYADYDKTTTEQAREELAQRAIDMFPELANYPIVHHWAGLRPGSPKGIPFIGKLPNLENLYINAGHFRNGLVLAPASVKLTTSLLLNDEVPFDPAPYDPQRVF